MGGRSTPGAALLDENYCFREALGNPLKPLVSPASDGALQEGLKQGLLKGLFPSSATIQPIRRYAVCKP